MAIYHDDRGAFHTCDFDTREEMEKGIEVGARVLLMDTNRRIYKRPEGGGYASGGPLHRGYYRGARVVGETSRSWVLEGGRKIPKKTLKGLYSNHCADMGAWLAENGYRIIERVRLCRDPHLLAELRERLDMQDIHPPPPKPGGNVRERFGDVANNGRD